MDTPEFWYLTVLLLLLVAMLLRSARRGMARQLFLGLLIWGGIGTVATGVYLLRHDIADLPARFQTEITGQSKSADTDSLRLRLDQRGHATLTALINDTPVVMLLDTGATKVTLQKSDATRLGISPDPSQFTRTIRTANGTVLAADVTLRRVRIDPIILKNVTAVVFDQDIGISLLGMSALGRISMTYDGDYVTLSP